MSGGKKLAVIVMVCILASFAVSGCGNPEYQNSHENGNNEVSSKDESSSNLKNDEVFDQIEASTETEYLSLDEAIDHSHCIVVAKLNSISDKKHHRKYGFTHEETIIGQMSEVNFLVTVGYADPWAEDRNKAYSNNEKDYEIGKEYVLVLAKIPSVYLERDQYNFVGDTFIELDDAGNITQYRRYGQKEESPYKTAEEFAKHARSVTEDSKERFVTGFHLPDRIKSLILSMHHNILLKPLSAR